MYYGKNSRTLVGIGVFLDRPFVPKGLAFALLHFTAFDASTLTAKIWGFYFNNAIYGGTPP
jgi:hypothetical protein